MRGIPSQKRLGLKLCTALTGGMKNGISFVHHIYRMLDPVRLEFFITVSIVGSPIALEIASVVMCFNQLYGYRP